MFNINDIKLIHGDCLEEMGKLINKGIKVDMILCDLPYGTTKNKWDIMIDLDRLWDCYKKIIKENGAIVLFSQTPFDKALGYSNLKWLKYEWIWQKNIATGHLNAKKLPMKEHENILVFYKKLPTYNPQMTQGEPYINKRKKYNDSGNNYGYIERTDTINKGVRYPKSILKFDRQIGLHPTQKPIDLCEYFVKTYSNKNELVLDNCMGSGTTGVACKNLNRKFIGIELDENYFNIAKDRIENT